MPELRLLQYASAKTGDSGGSDPKIISRQLLTAGTLETLVSAQGCKMIWNLPLSALQRKIGELGRFCLPPDVVVIDNVLEITLYDYLNKSLKSGFELGGREANYDVYWVEGKGEGSRGSQDSSHKGPMKENDWDYVFQANAILTCSFIDSKSQAFKKAPFAAFRIRDSSEEEAELPLPQDDEKAKIPTWRLSSEPARTQILDVQNEIEKSATQSSHSKNSINVGLSGSYKKLTGELKFGRDTERSFTSTSTFLQKGTFKFIVHKVPTCEISLHKGNSRLSDGCHQALLRLRAYRRFEDLMRFFDQYGTIYAKRVVLGGRLISSERQSELSTGTSIKNEETFKKNASASLGILGNSIDGGWSNEHGSSSESSEKQKTSQAAIDWTAYGGSKNYVSDPDKWHQSLDNYRTWEIVDNKEIEPIQNFIGSLPGCDDIPELFENVLRVGLYDLESIWLCQGPNVVSPPNKDDAPLPVQSEFHPLGACVDTLSGKIRDSSPFGEFPPKENTPGATVVKGGISWRVLDSASDVLDQIVSLTPMGTSLGTNFRCVPRYFYNLTMAPKTITVVLQWSTDTVRFGKALDPSINPSEQAGSLNNELVQKLIKASEDWNADLKTKESCAQWSAQAMQVNSCLTGLADEGKKNPDASLYSRILKLHLTFGAKLSYVQSLIDGNKLDPETLELLKITILPEMGENVRNVLDAVQRTPARFTITAAASAVLGEDNASVGAGKFINTYGHAFIDSYTEAGKLSATWSLTVDEKTTEQNWMIVRVLINQYFAAARTVNEVCEFFASGISSYLSKDVAAGVDAKDAGIKFDVKTTVFGYRSMTSLKPRILQDLDPRQAKYYVTPEALARNRVQTSYHLQPFQGLPTSITKDSREEKSLKALTNPHPDQTFILILQDIQRKLFVLNAYSKVPNTINSTEFLESWDKFNDLQAATNMDADGKITSDKALAMEKLAEDLQKRIFKAEKVLA